ncbi:MAG: hypothetical protein AB7Q37_06765 [Pyrinomonadaceae bacterium]
MNSTITSPNEATLSKSLLVEYYPSVEDCVHVAERVNSAAAVPTATLVYIYYGFLALNLLGVPMLLWFADLFFTGLIVFGFNLASIFFLLPNVNKSQYRKYFERLHGDCENYLAKVELDDRGVLYSSRGNELFFPWANIIEVEDSENSIHLHYEHNAISVQKTGFAYKQLEQEFISFARSHQVLKGGSEVNGERL